MANASQEPPDNGRGTVVSLKIEGAGLAPQTFDIAELAAFLHKLRNALTKFAGQDRRPKSADAEVVLKGIGSGSIMMDVGLCTDKQVDAYEEMCATIETGRPTNIARWRAVKELKDSIRADRTCVFYRTGEQERAPAKLTRTTRLRDPQLATGMMNLFGLCTHVGGKVSPSATVEREDGKSVRVSLSQDLARKITVYNFVSIDGLASWDQESGDVQEFEAEAVRPLSKKRGALKRLSDFLGPHLRGLDLDAFDQDQRGD